MVRSCILMSFLWTISTAGLVNECNFDGVVTKAAALQNLSFISSSSSVMFSRTLPSTRTSSHSCIVTTEDKDSFLYVKAKTSGEKNGKIERLFIADKHVYRYMDRSYFLFQIVTTYGHMTSEFCCAGS